MPASVVLLFSYSDILNIVKRIMTWKKIVVFFFFHLKYISKTDYWYYFRNFHSIFSFWEL